MTIGHNLTISSVYRCVKRMNDRKAREFARREQDILDATLALLLGEQWETLSVDKIARHTGIGKGTVYKHFGCKDDIYARLLLDNYQRILMHFQQIAADKSLTGVQQVRHMLIYAFEHHRDNIAEQRMHVHFIQNAFRERLSRTYQQQLIENEQHFTAAFGQAIKQGIAEGDVNPDMPLDVMMAGMKATFEGAMIMLQEDSGCYQPSVQTREQQNIYMKYVVDYMIAALIRQPIGEQK